MNFITVKTRKNKTKNYLTLKLVKNALQAFYYSTFLFTFYNNFLALINFFQLKFFGKNYLLFSILYLALNAH